MSYWEPDDPPELPDGWWSEEDVEEIRDLMRHYEYPDSFPRVGNRNDAILVMIGHKLNPPRVGTRDDPHIIWARTLLKDIL